MSFEIEAEEAIKLSGGRISKQRKELIHLLATATGEIDAESLYQLAQQRDAHISLATVYRTLTTLADAGLIQRRYVSPEHERQYFERSPEKEKIHVVCRQCHRHYTIEGEIVSQFKNVLSEQHDWHSLSICSCVTALCPDCYAASLKEGEEA